MSFEPKEISPTLKIPGGKSRFEEKTDSLLDVRQALSSHIQIRFDDGEIVDSIPVISLIKQLSSQSESKCEDTQTSELISEENSCNAVDINITNRHPVLFEETENFRSI